MAKQALKEEFEFPAGGIADFYMEDHEIEALEQAEAEEEFGSAGIATFQPIANRMASYGRYGDDTVAHVETGELIVPKALIDQNPKLKASIFNHLRELGVEDPERYVVGSGVNSINPETGMPEFFLKKIFKGIKKTASKVAKGVSKAVKGVAKVIKKAAPVIIPFALNAMFPGLGAIYSGALGSGIGTLIQGGSLKDAFKNALIGGAIGGATAAIGGGMQAAKAGGTFGEGAMKGIQDAAKLSNLKTAGQQLASGQFGQSGYDAVTMDPAAAAYPDYGNAPVTDPQVAATQATALPSDAAPGMSKPPLASDMSTQLYGPDPQAMPTGEALYATAPPPPQDVTSLRPPPEQVSLMDKISGGAETVMDYGQKGMDFLTGTPDTATINQIELDAYNKAIQAGAPKALAEQQAARAVADATPGLLRTYGPSLALAGGAAYAGGMFDTPEPDDEPTVEELQGPTGVDLIAGDPGKYLVTGNTESPMTSTGQYVVGTDYAYNPLDYFNQNPFLRPGALAARPIQAVADGGEIFPRRVGGIMPNEGIPGQDSVRAMLMPGEFVMTTNAVKGLGNGNNQVGINRMYDMMRGLEAKGKAMA